MKNLLGKKATDEQVQHKFPVDLSPMKYFCWFFKCTLNRGNVDFQHNGKSTGNERLPVHSSEPNRASDSAADYCITDTEYLSTVWITRTFNIDCASCVSTSGGCTIVRSCSHYPKKHTFGHMGKNLPETNTFGKSLLCLIDLAMLEYRNEAIFNDCSCVMD